MDEQIISWDDITCTLIAHPHLHVWATSERYLRAWPTFTFGLANERAPLDATTVGTHNTLVAQTSMCGWTISHTKYIRKVAIVIQNTI